MIARIRQLLARRAASILSNEAKRQAADRRADKLSQLRSEIRCGIISPIAPRDVVVAGVRQRRACH